MRILHLTTYLQGGAGRIIYDLALEQKRLGHTVSLATSKTEYPGYCNYPEYLDGLRSAGIPFRLVDSFFKRDGGSFAEAKKQVSELIKRERPNIIHCHASMPALAALESICDLGQEIPILQTMQGWGTNKTEEQTKQDIDTMNQISHVVAVSNASMSLLVSLGLQKDKISVIPNFVSPKTTLPFDDTDYKSLENKAKTRKIIGCIGSLCSRKNQSLLIKALPLIDHSIDPLTLALIGEGKDEAQLRNLAIANPSKHEVLFLGYKSKADRFLPLFDAFVLPSLAEGLPLSIVEAFRENVPVLCSDIAEHKEIIENRISGFLFNSGDARSLAEAINEIILLDLPQRDKITSLAYDIYLKRYTIKRVSDQYLSLYRKFFDKSR